MDGEFNLENRYHPQHPLPEEIQEMPRDDTVCQFCGVSYLIHNEIKNLQEQLNVYKNEVDRLKGFDERERKLNEQLSLLTVKSNDLHDKWQIEVKRRNEHEELILKKNVNISQLKGNIENQELLINSEKAKTENLTKTLEGLIAIAVKIATTSKILRKELANIRTLYQGELDKLMSSWDEQKSWIMQKVSHFVKLYDTCKENNKRAQQDFVCQSANYKRKIQEADVKCERQRIILEKCSEGLTGCMSRITLYGNQLESFQQRHSVMAAQYSSHIAGLNRKVNMLRTHVKSLMNSQSHDNKSFTSSIEKYKQENKQLYDERSRMVNAHQHQLKQLHDSFMEKLALAEEWPSRFDEKVKELEEKFNDEKSQLLEGHKESLKHAAEAHAEEYMLVNKSKEKCELELKKLEEKVKAQQRKFNEEKSQLLKQVTESHEKAAAETEARYVQMDKEKDNHLRIIRKLEQQLESMQVKFHEEMLKQVEQHDKEKRNMVAMFDGRINELANQLDKEKGSKANILNNENENLVDRIKELEAALNRTKEVLREKTTCIEENRKEISSLRDCVRRECEERYELTESLAEARTDLLSLQRFSNGYSPKKISSHPLIYNSQTNPSKISETKSPRKHGVKLEELSKSCGNLDGSKAGLDILPPSPASAKSHNSGRTSVSHYSKNKLRISLKNN